VKPTLPFVPGHEGAGVVAAVGQGVTGVKEGDPVGVAWLHDACGACEYCIAGWETLCEAQHNSGYSVDGAFAEYVIGSAAYVARLPDRADFMAMAPILCAGVTTYKGIKETEAKPGQWLAISGLGGLGHLAVQYGKAMGLHVAALDVTDEKLALARSLGADATVNAKAPDAVQQIVTQTGGGAHGVLVTAVSPAAFAQALRMVRRKGTVSLVGLPPGDFPTPIFDVVLKRITIRGSIVGTRADLAEAIAFAAEGRVRAHIHAARLDDVNRVLSDLRAGKVEGRIVLGGA
jgi:propanol-preferring alcohol dehydrogenase